MIKMPRKEDGMSLSTFEILGGYRHSWTDRSNQMKKTKKTTTALEKLAAEFRSYPEGHEFGASLMAEYRRGGVGCRLHIAQLFCEKLVEDGLANKFKVGTRLRYLKLKNAE